MKWNIREVGQASKSKTGTMHRRWEMTRWSVNTLLPEIYDFKTVISSKLWISTMLDCYRPPRYSYSLVQHSFHRFGLLNLPMTKYGNWWSWWQLDEAFQWSKTLLQRSVTGRYFKGCKSQDNHEYNHSGGVLDGWCDQLITLDKAIKKMLLEKTCPQRKF